MQQHSPPSNNGNNISFKPGDIVWCKLRSYPHWPGYICSDSQVTSRAKRAKPSSSISAEDYYPVFFLGSYDYTWASKDQLCPFQPYFAQFSKPNGGKRVDKQFEMAVKEAQSVPNCLEKLERVLERDKKRTSARALSDDDEDGESSASPPASNADGGGSKVNKPESKRPKTLSKASSSSQQQHRKEQQQGHKRLVSRKDLSSSSAATTTAAKSAGTSQGVAKRNLLSGKNQNRIKSRLAATSANNENQKKPVTKVMDEDEDDAGAASTQAAAGDKTQVKFSHNSEIPLERLMYYRYRLQKHLLSEVPGDLSKCDGYLKIVEEFPITIDLLKESKIAKLMRRIAQQPPPKELVQQYEQFQIKERAEKLTDQWKLFVQKESETMDGATITTTTTTTTITTATGTTDLMDVDIPAPIQMSIDTETAVAVPVSELANTEPATNDSITESIVPSVAEPVSVPVPVPVAATVDLAPVEPQVPAQSEAVLVEPQIVAAEDPTAVEAANLVQPETMAQAIAVTSETGTSEVIKEVVNNVAMEEVKEK